MILHFKHKGLKWLYTKGDSSAIPASQRERIEEILTILDNAGIPEDADIPGYRLHPLTGNKKGLWSIRVSANWRITFRFEVQDVTDVNLEDYH